MEKRIYTPPGAMTKQLPDEVVGFAAVDQMMQSPQSVLRDPQRLQQAATIIPDIIYAYHTENLNIPEESAIRNKESSQQRVQESYERLSEEGTPTTKRERQEARMLKEKAEQYLTTVLDVTAGFWAELGEETKNNILSLLQNRNQQKEFVLFEQGNISSD